VIVFFVYNYKYLPYHTIMFLSLGATLLGILASRAEATCSGTGFHLDGSSNCVCDTANNWVGGTKCGKVSVSSNTLVRGTGFTCPEGAVDLSSFSAIYINQDVFSACDKLTSVQFPPNLERIYKGAFQNTDIRSVHFPNTLTWIADNAFKGSSLTGIVDLSNTQLEGLGNNAFENTNIDTVKFPSTMRYLQNNIFSGAITADFSLAGFAVSFTATSLAAGSQIIVNKDTGTDIVDSFASKVDLTLYDDVITTDCGSRERSDGGGGCECNADFYFTSNGQGECECAEEYELYDDVCVATCQTNQIRSADGICECAEGYELYNDVCVATCQTNQVRSTDGICECNAAQDFVSDDKGRCCLNPIPLVLWGENKQGHLHSNGWGGRGWMHYQYSDGTTSSASGSWSDYLHKETNACIIGAWWGSASGDFAEPPWISYQKRQVARFDQTTVKRANCCGLPGTGDVIYSNCDDPRESFQKRVVDGETVYGCFNTCHACVDACSTPEHAKTLKTRHAELTACHTDLEVTDAAEACTISCMREKCQESGKDLIAEKYKEIVVKKEC